MNIFLTLPFISLFCKKAYSCILSKNVSICFNIKPQFSLQDFSVMLVFQRKLHHLWFLPQPQA